MKELGDMPMNQLSEIPVVILAGGRGSRLGEYTEAIPKPMVEIQGVPIIERIIRNFQKHGFKKFIVSAGYREDVLASYFFTRKDVNVVDTGIETQTAGRILGVRGCIGTQNFLACYGDGITDYNPCNLLEQHLSHPSSVCTLMAVHPLGRFGEISFSPRGLVTKFSEKPIGNTWINGGYFCFSKEIFKYLSRDYVLETDVFTRLVHEKKLFCDSHDGFWRSVDTPKDVPAGCLKRLVVEGLQEVAQ